ncbi:hypothetical protein H257_08730 [Aphanomyces astaci]|uniref:Uncharacterized protein n=1 Tax=Aphanomyces astaci TaxID=112090 RepID=W4GDC4_APHAT|nr:hypothetical protein H257_08730 [Aphanomyces astaci]ETV77281.1 hypothetical protein H257_08730 [Aphanomyces astaci]|eukprot:XP_009833068.1 hypothetical protein H257_08730 [Aphanomyces astaci]
MPHRPFRRDGEALSRWENEIDEFDSGGHLDQLDRITLDWSQPQVHRSGDCSAGHRRMREKKQSTTPRRLSPQQGDNGLPPRIVVVVQASKPPASKPAPLTPVAVSLTSPRDQMSKVSPPQQRRQTVQDRWQPPSPRLAHSSPHVVPPPSVLVSLPRGAAGVFDAPLRPSRKPPQHPSSHTSNPPTTTTQHLLRVWPLTV